MGAVVIDLSAFSDPMLRDARRAFGKWLGLLDQEQPEAAGFISANDDARAAFEVIFISGWLFARMGKDGAEVPS